MFIQETYSDPNIYIVLKDAGEASSDESDVELDMDGVLENPDTEEPHEMGDPDKKEMTDEEMEQFDEARSSAMGTFSEVRLL